MLWEVGWAEEGKGGKFGATVIEYTRIIIFKKGLAGVAQWIASWPAKWKATGSIPSQGTCLGCRLVPSWGHARGNWLLYLSHIDVSLPLFLPPSLLSKIHKIFKRKTKIIQCIIASMKYSLAISINTVPEILLLRFYPTGIWQNYEILSMDSL